MWENSRSHHIIGIGFLVVRRHCTDRKHDGRVALAEAGMEESSSSQQLVVRKTLEMTETLSGEGWLEMGLEVKQTTLCVAGILNNYPSHFICLKRGYRRAHLRRVHGLKDGRVNPT